mmetsp:Transcript_4622/g.8130  ORF Transcript_4622/g.8130 Transcript_4622/m.8130 type:complete len:123 (+) Transcript_4622:533-901(+)
MSQQVSKGFYNELVDQWYDSSQRERENPGQLCTFLKICPHNMHEPEQHFDTSGICKGTTPRIPLPGIMRVIVWRVVKKRDVDTTTRATCRRVIAGYRKNASSQPSDVHDTLIESGTNRGNKE